MYPYSDPYGVPRYPYAYPVLDPNPLTAGLQMGLLGASSGLGYAAIHRALRLRAGDQTPVAVLKPTLVGALLGAALGTLGALKTRSYMQQSESKTGATKYAGLKHIVGMEKDALGPALAIPLAALQAMWTAQGIYGAGRNLVQGAGSAARGDWGGAGRHGLAAGGNALLALPGVGMLRTAQPAWKLYSYLRGIGMPAMQALRASAGHMKAVQTTRSANLAALPWKQRWLQRGKDFGKTMGIFGGGATLAGFDPALAQQPGVPGAPSFGAPGASASGGAPRPVPSAPVPMRMYAGRMRPLTSLPGYGMPGAY